MEMEPDLWQGIVNIAQVPGNEGTEENKISWLCNPFGDDTVYTTQFVLDLEKNDDRFSWNFFLTANKKDSATAKTSFGEGFNKAKGLLRKRGLIVSYCSIFAQYFAFGGLVTLLPLYIKNLGMEAFHVGMLLATFAIMFIILQFPSGAVSDKVGRLMPTAAGLSLSVVSLVILPSQVTFPLLAMTMALYGAAYGILFPSISALVADHASPEERGMATGIFHALLTAGVAIGAPVMGWAGEMVGVELGLMLSSGVMVLALVIVLGALRQRV